jgi:outer membrane protein
MLLRRALALSALALTTALAADNVAPSPTPIPSKSSRSSLVKKSALVKKPALVKTPAPFVSQTKSKSKPSVTPPPAPAFPSGPRTQILTLREAIDMALENNIDIQWHKTDLRFDDAQMHLAWGDFDPSLSFSSTYTYSQTPQNPTIITSADTAQQILLEQEAIAEIQANAAPTPVPLPSTNPTPTPAPAPTPNSSPFIFQNEDFRNSLDVQGKLPLGTTFKFGVEVDHLNDTVLQLPNQDFLPSNDFFAGLSVDQPLLQGFGFDANLVSVRIARRNRQVGFNNWHQRVIDSVGLVMAAYFDMSYAQALMDLRQQTMQEDRTLAQANQRRVDVGLMTPLDVRQAEADISAAQYDFLTAQNFLTARVADLKKLVYHGVEQDDGRTFLAAGPADLPIPVLDRDSLIADAFQNRVDYATAIQQSAIEDIRLKYYRNQILPHIDVVATLGANGLSTSSASDAYNSALNGQGPEWSIGIQGSIPFGNVAARANLAASHRLKEEAVWKIKQVELAINTDVDTAISAIQTNEQRVASSRQTRDLAEDVVRMENGRLEQGQASTADLLEDGRRLNDAKSAVLEAIDELNKSIVQLYLATGTLLHQESIILDDNDPNAPKHPMR